MRKFTFTIGNKIFGGFLLLVAIFIINGVIIYFTSHTIKDEVNELSKVVQPSQKAIADFTLLVTRSKMLTTNWVYLESNDDDKKALKILHGTEYDEVKRRLNSLQLDWKDKKMKSSLDSAITEFEDMLKSQQAIMAQLATFESYNDPMIKLTAESDLEDKVIPQSKLIIDKLNKIAFSQDRLTEASNAALVGATDKSLLYTISLSVLITIIGLSIAYIMTRTIINPINQIKNLILTTAQGELVKVDNTKFSEDEIGEMAHATDKLVHMLNSTALFAENIGKGNYSIDFNPISEKDVLGNALLMMKNNLYRVAEEDKMRAWTTQGLAQFGEILRNYTDQITQLCEEIITGLVKYTKSNQGAIFIVEEDEQEPYLELTACYAWNRKKHMKKRILWGEGLIGQSWQEKDSLYITDVPDEFIKITSGLGSSNPTNILIVPLVCNDIVFGVLEIASLQLYAPHEREFVEQLGKSIASTISNVKTNKITKQLLEESQLQTETMKSQEEEMRQNMEELAATQEEMQRHREEMEVMRQQEIAKYQMRIQELEERLAAN